MSAVKFPALAIGQRFSLRGIQYVKTSPVLARAEVSGQSQMIPRSAQVELLGTQAQTEDSIQPMQAIVNELHRAALSCLETLAKASAASAPQLAQARKHLKQAHQQALAKLTAHD